MEQLSYIYHKCFYLFECMFLNNTPKAAAHMFSSSSKKTENLSSLQYIVNMLDKIAAWYKGNHSIAIFISEIVTNCNYLLQFDKNNHFAQSSGTHV